MRLLPLGLLSLLWASQCTALHESDVGVVDWFKPFVGVPDYTTPATAPTFHRIGQKNTQSLVLTATQNNVLAALNPVNGSLVWRYIFEPVDHIASFYKHENAVAALSGPGGSTLRLFDALTGDLLLEKRLHSPQEGILFETGYVGVSVAFKDVSHSQLPDLFVLTNGKTVNRIGGRSGEVQWTWTSPEQSSLVLHSRIITTPSAVYLVGLAKSFASYTLHLTALSSDTGELLAEANIPSKLTRGMLDVLPLKSPNSSEALIVWVEDGSQIKTFPLSTTLKGKPSSFKGSYHQVVDVTLNDYGQFVALKADKSAVILGLSEDGTSLKKLWEFEGSAPAQTHTESIYAGGLDKDRKPYITRLYWSHVINLASVEVYASHLADGKGLLTGFSFPFETNYYGVINHIAIDAANPKEFTVLARLFLTTSTGTVQLWQHEKFQWTREESLATVRVSQFVELPEPVLTHLGEVEEGFAARVRRQAADAQNFPTYLLNFIKRFATGSYASVSSSAAASTKAGSLTRDPFGFRQIIVVATDFGKVFGIDSSTGEILWDKLLGLGWAAQVGGRVFPVKMFVTRTVSDGEFPVVILVTQRRAENSLVDTALFEFNVLTGETVLEGGVKAEVLHGRDVIDGALVDAFMLPVGDSKIIVLLDEFLQVRLFPDTDESKAKFSKLADKLGVPLLMNIPNYPGRRRVVGHQITLNPALSDNHVAYPTWTLSLPPEESVQSLIPLSRGPLASFGKVLGNRTTLYKYLNPRLSVVLTATHSVTPIRCGVYVVDTAKGSIVYQADLPSSKGTCDVKATLTENWLVYYYFDEEFAAAGQTKGYRVVSVEFYEGQQVDDKTKSSELSSFSEKMLNVTAYEQTYLLAGPITALATTSTKYGISGKDLIVAQKNNRIQSLSRRFLNPRRPNRKTTTEEQEEFLIPYDPLLPDDPRRVLSHNYPVSNIQRIITSPALLESTSLVFAHGLDLFLTRVAPSNTFDVLSENFNKAQLVFTVGGLALAILITRPMVRRKRLREKWYQ